MNQQIGGGGDTNKDNTFDSERRQSQLIDFGSAFGQSKPDKYQQMYADQSNLWQAILNDVAQRDDFKESHLLVLGDKGAGKRSLIQSVNKHIIRTISLQRANNRFIDIEKMGSQIAGLDSSFLYVKDLNEKDGSIVTVDENIPRINVWITQDPEKADLIKLVLKPEDLQYTCAVIVLDFDQPWEMMNSLQRWMGVLGETILEMMKALPLTIQDKMKERLSSYVKNYERKEDDEEGKAESKQKTEEEETKERDDDDYAAELKSKLPLPEGVLKVNLGIPIIVVCNKVDLLMRGDKAQFLEQSLEFIQKHLRQYTLSYAASLIFTEVQQNTNLEILYKYVLHRLYDFEFPHKAQIFQKESIFLPTGYDSLLLIDGLCKGAIHENKIFEEVIKKPASVQQQQNRPEVNCDDWQAALSKQHGIRRLVHSGPGGPGPSNDGQRGVIDRSGAAQVNPGGQQPRSNEEQKRSNVQGFYEGLLKRGNRAGGAGAAGGGPVAQGGENGPVAGTGPRAQDRNKISSQFLQKEQKPESDQQITQPKTLQLN